MSTEKHIIPKTTTFDWQKIGQVVTIPQGIRDIEMQMADDAFLVNHLMARMTAFVLTEKLPPVQYRHYYPGVQTWVDRLKLWLTPRWGFRWLERFPARPSTLVTTVTLEPYYVYPDAQLPHEVSGDRTVRMHSLTAENLNLPNEYPHP